MFFPKILFLELVICQSYPWTTVDNTLQNVYILALLMNFGIKSLADGGKFVQDKNGDLNSPQANKPFFFPNLHKLYYLYILMNFYLVFYLVL
jgi:hypothetical protein